MSTDITPSVLARLYHELAGQVEHDPATSFTAADVYDAMTRLHQALGAKLRDVDVIRGRPRPEKPKRVRIRLR